MVEITDISEVVSAEERDAVLSRMLPAAVALGPGPMPDIPIEERRVRTFEFLRVGIDPDTASATVLCKLLFKDPADVGIALGEVVANFARAYADAGLSFQGVPMTPDGIADRIYAAIAQNAFTEDVTLEQMQLRQPAAGQA